LDAAEAGATGVGTAEAARTFKDIGCTMQKLKLKVLKVFTYRYLVTVLVMFISSS
jgi:hypothetical protein